MLRLKIRTVIRLNKISDIVMEVKKLKESSIAKIVKERIKEFEEIGKGSNEEIFKELAFCLLTANYSAEGGMKIQRLLDEGLITLPEEELERRLRDLGHRFPKTRAKYIVNARKLIPRLKDILGSLNDEKALREWLVKNVKGLGYKEASHFLRNVGFKNLAIVDFHIVDLLVRYGLIEKPKSMTKRRYMEIEDLLEQIARETELSLAELDLYLWYMETGKILK